MGRKSKYTREIAIAASILVHGDKYDYTDSVFTLGMDSTLSMRCPVHGMFTIRLSGHIKKGYGCKKCGSENRARPKRGAYKNTPTEEEMYAKFHVIHGDRYLYPLGAYINASDEMEMICRIHGPFKKSPALHLRGHGCRLCHLAVMNKDKQGTLEEFLPQAHKLHGDRFDYSKVVWFGFKKRIELVCREHKRTFWKEPYVHLRGAGGGCPSCHRSKGEQSVESILDRLEVEYIPEFSFVGYRYEFDFYLPDYQLFIEFHGTQHYYSGGKFGGVEVLLLVQKRDNVKASMVKTAGADMVVFDFRQFNDKTLEAAIEHLIKNRPKKPRDIPFYTHWLEHQESLKPKAQR